MAASNTEIAWCAGFLDGEGSFLAKREARHRRPEARRHARAEPLYRPALTAAQAKVRTPLDRLAAHLGGNVYSHGHTKSGNPVFHWRLESATRLREVLPLLIPLLVVKQEEARVVLRLASLIGAQANPRRITDDELAARRACADDLLAIRRRAA